MKIAAIQPLAIDVPFRENSSRARRRKHGPSTLPLLFVRVETDEGTTGWGESFALNVREATYATLVDTVIPRCIGKDPCQIADLTQEIRFEFRNGKAGPLTYALAAVDIALWDIVGKLAGLPLHRLWGGGVKKTVPAYASLIPFNDPSLAAGKAREMMERGYRHLKLHETTFEPVAAVRKAVGDDIPIMVDANCPWTVPQAVEMARRFEDLGIAWLEEPVWPPEDYAALAQVACATAVPIAAGENACSVADFRLMCETAGLSYAQPSVGKMGGVTEMHKAIAVADALNVALVPHAYYLGPALLASLHLIAARSRPTLFEHAVFDLESHPYAGLIEVEDGEIPVPQTPGLGPGPDPAFLARYAAPMGARQARR